MSDQEKAPETTPEKCGFLNKIKTPIMLTFKLLNSATLLFSIGLVIFNLCVQFVPVFENLINGKMEEAGVSDGMMQTFVTISTLLVSFLSGICAMGMESAGYKDEWENPIFVLFGKIYLLPIKMIIYVTVFGIIGFGALILVGVLHSGVATIDWAGALESQILGGCGDTLGDLVDPLQQDNNCCGLIMDSSSCGNYESNVPSYNCDCQYAVGTTDFDTHCVLVADAVIDYNCTFTGVTPIGIYKTGCMDTGRILSELERKILK